MSAQDEPEPVAAAAELRSWLPCRRPRGRHRHRGGGHGGGHGGGITHYISRAARGALLGFSTSTLITAVLLTCFSFRRRAYAQALSQQHAGVVSLVGYSTPGSRTRGLFAPLGYSRRVLAPEG